MVMQSTTIPKPNISYEGDAAIIIEAYNNDREGIRDISEVKWSLLRCGS